MLIRQRPVWLPAASGRPSGSRSDGLIVWAPAKLNLFLEVCRRRPDGYHDIATLMIAVSLFDSLRLARSEEPTIELTCNRLDLSTGPDNLVVRAAELLRQRTGYRGGVRIHLHKRIPMQAGLAGGSTDAAATLAGLNQLWQLNLTPAELMALAAELGSDIAFFFATPAAWCTGRGEIVTPESPGAILHFVLVSPAVGLATPQVYRAVRVPDVPLTGDSIRQAVRVGDVEAIGQALHNRLQAPACQLCPEVQHWYERIREQNPVGCLMSGSGSSLFALCRDRQDALRVARQLRFDRTEGMAQPRFRVVHSCV